MSIKISVVIPTYNCNEFLEKAITSVLVQDLGPDVMEIEVVDDYSIDDPKSLIEMIGKGRVKYFRQAKNVGHVKNFETGIKRSSGEIIHILHGDDFVLPGFYDEILKLYDLHPEIGACFTRHFFVNEHDEIVNVSEIHCKSGVFENFYNLIHTKQLVQTPSITVKKSVYLELGYFDINFKWAEDWEMWSRISMKYKIGFTRNILACYRIHSSSSSGQKMLSGENIQDLTQLERAFEKRLFKDKRTLIKMKASFSILKSDISEMNFYESIRFKARISRIVDVWKYSSSMTKKIFLTLLFIKKRLYK
jgi:glycosyltransferase involved in cell wall biosynthesis